MKDVELGFMEGREELEYQSVSANMLQCSKLNYDRNVVRILVGLLTGHRRLNEAWWKTLGRFCQEEEATAIHVLCHMI